MASPSPPPSSASTAAALSLRPWPPVDDANGKPPPLSTLIERITTQKGSFRNVSEQSLEDEIAAREAGTAPADANAETAADAGSSSESEEEEGEEEEEKPPRELLYEAKAELLKFAGQAFNESAQTLDFLSLLMTKYAPKQAEMTLSPVLKSMVPMGSLGAELLEPPTPEEQEHRRRQSALVATGWKLQSLSSAADSLLSAAASLEGEMEKEARYWREVLAVKDKGWSVCRMPRERHTLAVRYGFREAAPEFRDKGLAALRRDEDGSIDLDLGRQLDAGRSLSVQILDSAGAVAADSRQQQQQQQPRQQEKASLDPKEHSVEQSILRARNDLFDEELFHEIYREARTMTSRGVKCIRGGISVPLESGLSMFIESKSSSSDDGERRASSQKTASPRLAALPALALTALRMLLLHSHRQNYMRRTRPPPPLVERRPQRPIPSILRPIVAHVEHRQAVGVIEAFIASLSALASRAGLQIAGGTRRSSLNLREQLAPLSQDRTSSAAAAAAVTTAVGATTTTAPSEDPADKVISAFLAPIRSTYELEMSAKSSGDDSSSSFALSVRTHAMGTEYKFAATPTSATSFLAQIPLEMSFSNAAELQEHACHVATLWLVDRVEKLGGGSSKKKWLASSPDEGELTTSASSEHADEGGDFETLIVSLTARELGLVWKASVQGAGEAERRATWRAGEGEEGSFFAKVAEFSRIVKT